MSTLSIPTRFAVPVWRQLRHADWPLLPLALLGALYGLRVLTAQTFAYWNTWLTYCTALLGAYCLVTCVRIILQSVCFDRTFACWSALAAAMVLAWPFSITFAYALCSMGVPTPFDWLPMTGGLVGAMLLAVPNEVQATRARWERRAAEREVQRTREQATQRQLAEARLAALQGQIEPHFLYNTLANARALVRQDAPAAERLLEHLTSFLRSAMPDLRAQSTPLGQELERARAYLEIARMRMGERLRFDIAASEEARACQVPPLSVMTLIENAIEHGIEAKVEGGRVQLTAVCTERQLRVCVEDDGPGFQSEAGEGVGLLNLQERLATLYGDAAQLRVEPGAAGGVRATIELPLGAGGTA